jgi:hypothetical protein
VARVVGLPFRRNRIDVFMLPPHMQNPGSGEIT